MTYHETAYSKAVFQEIMKNNDTNIWTGSRKSNQLWKKNNWVNKLLIIKSQGTRGETMLSRAQNKISVLESFEHRNY